MKATDLRAKSADELQAEVLRLQKEHFALRMQRASGQLGQSHLFQTLHDTPNSQSLQMWQQQSIKKVCLNLMHLDYCRQKGPTQKQISPIKNEK